MKIEKTIGCWCKLWKIVNYTERAMGICLNCYCNEVLFKVIQLIISTLLAITSHWLQVALTRDVTTSSRRQPGAQPIRGRHWPRVTNQRRAPVLSEQHGSAAGVSGQSPHSAAGGHLIPEPQSPPGPRGGHISWAQVRPHQPVHQRGRGLQQQRVRSVPGTWEPFSHSHSWEKEKRSLVT